MSQLPSSNTPPINALFKEEPPKGALPKHLSKNLTEDQSFNDRAEHLKKNIYASDKGKLRLLILQRDLDFMTRQPLLSVLDVGCGLGLMSEWALSQGHSVTACDCSDVMIKDMQARIGKHSSVNYQISTLQALEVSQPVDVVFCHAVLEWTKNQDEILDKLISSVKPGGYLSLMFYNAWAREMAQLVYGNYDYIDKGYQVRQRVKLSPHWPCIPSKIEEKLVERGMHIEIRSGVRVFYDIVRNKQHYEQFADDIIRHELRVSQSHPYWQMGRYVHFLAKKVR